METISGKVAVITGGASGIGFATAKALADKGAKIVLADIEAAALDKAVAALSSSGAKVEGVVCDVANLASVQHLADSAFSKMGGAHIVFNNAGVAINGHIAQMKHSDWEWIIKVDLWGPIHGVEAFLPRMIEQKQGGQIVFTSSIAGLVPTEGLGPYAVAKYGVVALAETLRREIRQHNIGVSVLCPLRVETRIGSSERNRTADFGGATVGGRSPLRARAVADHGHDLVERPFEVDRGGPGGQQHRIGALQRLVGRVLTQRQRHAIGSRRPDQRRAANHHGADGVGRLRERRQPCGEEPMRQRGLVDHPDRPPIRLEPDGAHGFAADFQPRCSDRSFSFAGLGECSSTAWPQNGHRLTSGLPESRGTILHPRL